MVAKNKVVLNILTLLQPILIQSIRNYQVPLD